MDVLKVNNFDVNSRIDKAVLLFEQGYNCSQSVFMAYADIYNIDRELAAAISTSFGGGVGRLRNVCGALSGAFMLVGLKYPHLNPTDAKPKNHNYKIVQKMANSFKSEMGSFICADLLKIKNISISHISAERNQFYYNHRPCTNCVALAAQLIGNEIAGKVG